MNEHCLYPEVFRVIKLNVNRGYLGYKINYIVRFNKPSITFFKN